MPKFSAKFIAKSALIAAMYATLTLVLQPLSFGTIQIRFSEALTMLPFLMTEGAVGVIVGCLIANCFSPFGLYDIIFGTLATAIAAVLTYKVKNKWLAALPPVLVNALILPVLWQILGSAEAYWINLLSIILSQSAVVFLLGVPLVALLTRILPSEVNNPKFLPQPNDAKTKKDID